MSWINCCHACVAACSFTSFRLLSLPNVPHHRFLGPHPPLRALARYWPSLRPIPYIRLCHDLRKVHDTTNAATFVHVVQAFIDVAQSLAVRDVLIDHEIAMHVSVNKARQLCAAFHTTES